MLTFVPLEEIYEYEKLEGSELNAVKERLGYELTKMIHGEQEAEKALQTARSLFSSGANADMPKTAVPCDMFQNGQIGILDVMLLAGMIPSKCEGRRLIQQGGVSIDDIKVTDPTMMLNKTDLEGDGIVIKKGKKVFHRITSFC